MLKDFRNPGLLPESPESWALPRHRHLPGTGTTPDMAPLDAVKSLCPESVTDSGWQDNTAYRYGWLLFANEYFWETHEVWEAVWLRTPVNSRQRFLLQCLIQLANARLKQRLGKPGAAERLLLQCLELMHSAYPPSPDRDQSHILGLSATNLFHLIKNA